MQIKDLQFEIDNPGLRATGDRWHQDCDLMYDPHESLADIERMIATKQPILNQMKLELTGPLHHIHIHKPKPLFLSVSSLKPCLH